MTARIPLRVAMTLSVVVGLVLPALVGAWQTLHYQREAMLAALRQDQERIADTLVLGMAPGLWNLNREDVAALASSVLRDTRVLRIRVDEPHLGTFIDFKPAGRSAGEPLIVQKAIRFRNQVLGTLRLEMSTAQLEARLAREIRRSLLIVGAELAVSLLLILFLLDQRFARPLRRLRAESVALAQRRLDTPFVWARGDELGELGQSLESTRLALDRAFRDIESKAQALEEDIVQRQRAEVALRESEARFRSLLALSSDGYWEQDEHFRFTRLGANAYQQSGLSVTDDLGKARWELDGVVEPDEDGWRAHRAMAEARQPYRGFEYGRRNPLGKVCYFSVSGEPVYDAAGRFCGYRGTVQNITPRKEAEAALRKTLLEQQILLDNALVGIEFVRARVIQRCNRGWEAMLGYEPGELYGKSTRLYYASDEEYDTDAALGAGVLEQGRTMLQERQFVRKDGSRIWCSYHGCLIDPDDAGKGSIWVYQDITDRKVAEQALTESEARFRSLTALSADWYWETDEAGRFTLLSPNFQERTGNDPARILGVRRDELAGVSYRPEDWASYTACIEARLPFHDLTYRVDQPGCLVQYGSDSGEPIFDAAGRFRGYRGIGRDLTAIRQADDARRSEIRLRRLVEHLPTGAIYVEDGSLLLNAAAEALTGYRRDEITTVDQWFDALAGPEIAARREGYELDRAAGFPEPRVVNIWRKDGEHRVIEFAIYADDYGEVWLAHDVTQRVAAEAVLQQTLMEQQAILDNALVGIAFMRDRRILRCNRSMEQIYGYASGELIGKTARVLHTTEDAYLTLGATAYPLIAAGSTYSGESKNVRKDGSPVWVSLQGKAVDPADLDKGVVWVNQDITARKEAEVALADAKSRLEAGMAELEQLNRDVTLLSELSGLLQACQSTDEAHAAIGAYGAYLFPQDAGVFFTMDPATRELTAVAAWGEGVHRPPNFSAEQCWALRRGQLYRVEQPEVELCCGHLAASPAPRRPYACIPMVAQGETLGLLYWEHRQSDRVGLAESHLRLATALAEQIALALANIQLRHTLRQQSIRDALTGLYNRRFLEETLQRELARAARKAGQFAVAVIDVDHFKQFNDNHGHDAGDLVLQAVAGTLQQAVREADVVCRFGGEEFVLVLPEMTGSNAQARAEGLLDAVRGLDLYHGDRPLGHVTVSLGLALYPDDGQTAQSLIDAADAALYQAKRTGRDRYVRATVAAGR